MRVSVEASNGTIWEVDGRTWWGKVNISIDDVEFKLTNDMEYQGRIDMINCVHQALRHLPRVFFFLVRLLRFLF